jgi:hypothetical protein
MGRPTRVAIQRDVPFEASSREALCRPDQDRFYDVDVSASQFVSISTDRYGSPCHTAAVPMQQVGPQQLS